MRGMTIVAMAVAALAGPATAQPMPAPSDEQVKRWLPAGETLETRADGDLDGDGMADLAMVSRGEDRRTLTVLRGVKRRADFDFAKVGIRALDGYAQGSAELAIARGVLKLEELTGGTTATSATYRYHYDARARQMRLIGLDATVYSRTYAHDGYEISWNLLTGALITRDLKVNKGRGDAAYAPIVERRGKRVSGPVYLAQTPDPDELIAAIRK